MSIDDKPTLFRPGVGKRGMNELHYAAYSGDMNELAKQLDAGANPNATDDYRNYTALHWLADMAATGGPRVQMLRLLVQDGANIHLISNSGQTALSLAQAAGNATGDQLASELLLMGASPDTPNDA